MKVKELLEKLFENKMNIVVGLLVLALFVFGRLKMKKP